MVFKVFTALGIIVTLMPGIALAQTHFLAPDVPTQLGAVTYMPSEIVLASSGSYASHLVLHNSVAINALYRLSNGDWLFTVVVPTTLAGTVFGTSDVIRFDGTNYTPYFDGAAAGVPPGTRIDAFFLDATGLPVMSFDIPTEITPGTFAEPADLVVYTGALSIYLDASSGIHVIPPSVNVIAADYSEIEEAAIVSFDIPVTIGGQTFMPGELVRWDGDTVASYAFDPGWPISSRVNGLSLFTGAPGEAANVMLGKSSPPGNLIVSWAPSCSGAASDYAIHSGQIDDWYSHSAIDCSDDGGDRIEVIGMADGDLYYLVVPMSAGIEGSYGLGFGGERPTSPPVCATTQVVTTCP